MRPKIRLQSDRRATLWVRPPATALRARQGPAAAFGGALRAALTRAHAAAWAQLCQRRNVLRWPFNERTFYRDVSFCLTEESRYALLANRPIFRTARRIQNGLE